MTDSSVDRYVVVSFIVAVGAGVALVEWLRRRRQREHRAFLPPVQRGIVDTIGNTPMIEIESLSRATGCRILAKMEFHNPGTLLQRPLVC